MRAGGVVALVLLAVASCAGSEARRCVSDSDCATGLCLSDGTCATPNGDAGGDLGSDLAADAGNGGGEDGGGGGVRDQGDGDGGGSDARGRDAAFDRGRGTDGTGGDGGDDGGGGADEPDARWPDLEPPLTCLPNRDGRWDRAEYPLEVGQRARFAVAFDASVDTAGYRDAEGTRIWDLEGPFEGERSVVTEVESPDAYWFAEEFDQVTYVARLTQSQNLLGVFRLTDTELLLLGVASPREGVNETLLRHDPPARVLQFPLAVGSEWSSTSTVTGLFFGLPSVWTERYESEVDGAGDLLTPYGTLPSARVRTTLTQTVGFVVTVRRTLAFVSECLGTVGVVRSQDNELDDDFDDASELSRLSP